MSRVHDPRIFGPSCRDLHEGYLSPVAVFWWNVTFRWLTWSEVDTRVN